jgi:hypothetical protein
LEIAFPRRREAARSGQALAFAAAAAQKRLLAMTEYTKRPIAVTSLIGLVLTFTGLQAIKLWAAISSWNYLNSLPLSVSPVYIVASAAIWSLVGGMLAAGLIRRSHWAIAAMRLAILAYFLHVWLDKLVLQPNGPQQSNWLFDLILSLAIIVSIIGTLALPKVRAYFGEGNE